MMYIYASFGGMDYIGEDQSFLHKSSFGNIGFPEAVVIREVLWTDLHHGGRQEFAHFNHTCQANTEITRVIDAGMFDPLAFSNNATNIATIDEPITNRTMIEIYPHAEYFNRAAFREAYMNECRGKT
jgi:hypothetical protein